MTWLPSLIVVWLQFALIAPLAVCLARRALARVPQPANRLQLIQITLASLLLLPALLWRGPAHSWQLQIPAENPANADRSFASTAPFAAPEPQMATGTTRPALAAIAPERDLPAVSATGRPTADSRPNPAADQPKATQLAAHSASTAPRGLASRLPWTWLAIAIGLLNALGLLRLVLWRGIGLLQWRRLCRHSEAADDNLAAAWHLVTQGRGPAVTLRVSSSIDSPLLFGWRRPVVMIPKSLAEAGGASLQYCLHHEWAHVLRGDFLMWRAVDTCQILFWWLPDYWRLCREMRLCQDMLADDLAASGGGDPIEYSALLVSLAQRRQTVLLAAPLTLIDHPSQLTRRVKMLLDPQRRPHSKSTWQFSLMTLAAAAILGLIAGVARIEVATAQEPTQESPQAAAGNDPVAKPAIEAVAGAKYRCRVVDKETGEGLAGATVAVRRSILIASEDRLLTETRHTTDATGHYDLEVSAEHAAEPALYIELDVEHPDYASKKGFGYAFSMIRKNEKLGERPFFEKTELFRGEAVTGTLVDPQGQPLAGERVTGFSMASNNDFNSINWASAETDAAGRFRVVFHKGGDAILWLIPRNFAIVEKFVAKKRGDLGTFQVSEGVRLAGQVLDIDRQPIAGVPVNINFAGERDDGGLPVTTSVRRGVVSDSEGRFAFDPLPAGDYKVTIDDHLQNPLLRERTIYDVPAVFVPKSVTLKAGEQPPSIQVQAVPHVVLSAQYIDSSGLKTRGHDFFLFGQMDGQFWNTRGKPDTNGTIKLLLPHGLEEAQMQLMTNEHGALRYRREPGGELQDNIRQIQLGTVNDDIEGFEIIRYKAPVILVSAVDASQQPIEKLNVLAKYTKPRPQQYIAFVNGSDVNFEQQPGGIYRSSQLLPDEEVTLTLSAEGYESAIEKLNLTEGATREIKVTLSKSK